MISGVEKEFMIASLRKQRDLLDGLVSQLKTKSDLDEGARILYDQITKQVEQNLEALKRFKKDWFRNDIEHSFISNKLKSRLTD